MNATQLAKRIGQRQAATTRRLLQESSFPERISREWTGFDEQDGLLLTAAHIFPGSEQWDEIEIQAHIEFEKSLI